MQSPQRHADTVCTSCCCCRGAAEVKVTLLDQSSYTARVVGADPNKDVAVLQLDMPADKAAQLQPVSVGMSSGLMVGQKVCGVTFECRCGRSNCWQFVFRLVLLQAAQAVSDSSHAPKSIVR